jgi:hypothetical protein
MRIVIFRRTSHLAILLLPLSIAVPVDATPV